MSARSATLDRVCETDIMLFEVVLDNIAAFRGTLTEVPFLHDACRQELVAFLVMELLRRGADVPGSG